MTIERKELLSKVNALIDKRKEKLLKLLPDVHEVNDGVVIRFFTEWDSCDENTGIKYKKIKSLDKPEDIIVYFYLPKGAHFELMERNYIHHLTCLNGKLEIDYDNKVRILETNTKISLESSTFEGRALENSYVVTTNV